MKFNKIYELILTLLNSTSNMQSLYVIPISNFLMGLLIASHSIINYNQNMNNDFNNLKKLLYDDLMQWYLYKINDDIVACAACKINLKWNSFFINELFSFKKGFGAKLLLYLLNLNYNIIYLNSDWTQADTLNLYYRQPKFNLTEYLCDRDFYKVHYFYKNNNLSKTMLKRFIEMEFI